MPVAAAAFLAARLSFDPVFLAARLSFEPVFRSALFADFLAFDKDPDFFRFFMCSSLCECAASRSPERVPPRSGVRLADLTPVARHLGENGLLGVGRQTHHSTRRTHHRLHTTQRD